MAHALEQKYCAVLGMSQSSSRSGESFPSDALHQEVSVSPASALGACQRFKVGAAQASQATRFRLAVVLSWMENWENCPCFKEWDQLSNPWSKPRVYRGEEGNYQLCLLLQTGQGYSYSGKSCVYPQ